MSEYAGMGPLFANARATDPDTSHAAAASLTPGTLRVSQKVVLACFRHLGPLTDVQLSDEYAIRCRLYSRHFPRQSPSGLRTRRKELVDGGLLRDSGERATLESGRQAIVWEVTPSAP